MIIIDFGVVICGHVRPKRDTWQKGSAVLEFIPLALTAQYAFMAGNVATWINKLPLCVQ